MRWWSSFVLTLVACGGGGGFPDAHVKDDTSLPPGTFKVAWTVSDTASAAITCDQVGAIVMTATVRSPAIAGGQTQVFTCSALMGESQAIAPGTYNIDFELDNGAGAVLAQGPHAAGIIIRSNQATQLDPVAFQVDAHGNADLHFQAPTALASAGNCADTTANGAGIKNTTITLVHQPGGACETATLNVGASAITGAPASTYTINCTTPVVVGCIEKDQDITATGIPSGNYQIHFRGLNGSGTACWTNDDQLAVPAIGGTLTRTLNLGKQSTAGC